MLLLPGLPSSSSIFTPTAKRKSGTGASFCSCCCCRNKPAFIAVNFPACPYKSESYLWFPVSPKSISSIERVSALSSDIGLKRDI